MYRRSLLYDWVRKLFVPPVRQQVAAPRHRRCRLELEMLEDRTLLNAGGLDPLFDVDGLVTTNVGSSYDTARAVAIQDDGKIVVAGSTLTSGFTNYDFAVARYNTDGSLDTTFGGDGIVTTGGTYQATDVAIQQDGKIVVVGFAGNDFAVVRYNTDGSLDTTFAGDGLATVTVGPEGGAYSVAIQTDGKIVVAGSTTYHGIYSTSDVAVARFNTDGSLDTSFDGDGLAFVDILGLGLDDQAYAVAIQADGKIVTAGSSNTGTELEFSYSLARLNSDGSLDTTFGGDGTVIPLIGVDDFIWDLAIQSDGKIVAAGGSFINDPEAFQYAFSVARYNSDGSLDTSFDGDGIALTRVGAISDWVSGVAIQADGKIVAAGVTFSGDPNDPDIQVNGNDDFALVRYNSDGSLDSTFGDNGIVRTVLGGYQEAYDVAIQTDGKIVVVGSGPGTSFNYDFALARYEAVTNPDSPATPPPATGDDASTVTATTTDEGATPLDNNVIQALLAQDEVQTDSTASTQFFIESSGSLTLTFTSTTSLTSNVGITFNLVGPLPTAQLPSGTSSTGEINGSVFRTSDSTETVDSLAGVSLVLEVERDGVFVVVATTTTDANGQYSFTGLPSGSYRVRPASPADLTISVNGGSSDAPATTSEPTSSRPTDAEPLEQFFAQLGRELEGSREAYFIEQGATTDFQEPSALTLTAATLLAGVLPAATLRSSRKRQSEDCLTPQ